MRILSIDPGYAILGFSVIDVDFEKKNIDIVVCGTITTKINDFEKRIVEIGDSFLDLCNKYKPDEIAIEQLFFVRNITTALYVAQIKGVILYFSEKSNIPVYNYTPLEIKLAVTSHGKATKKQVQNMVKQFFHLDNSPKSDDTSDALACAITHLIKKYNVNFW